MTTPDVRFKFAAPCAIASLTTAILSLPNQVIAVPASPTLAYYKPSVDAYELYVRPLWFGRSESDGDEVNSTQSDEIVVDDKSSQEDFPIPSLKPITESEAATESHS